MRKIIEVLIIAFILVVAFKLRYIEPYYIADLPIVPDSAQYAIGGYNLAHGKGPWVYINDLKLPLLYPIGFPMILAVFYHLTGSALHQAIYLVLVFSLLSILLTYLFVRHVFGTATALLAALLLTVAPLYVGYSQVLISDMVSNTFIIIGLWLAWLGVVRKMRNPWLWILVGVSCGFSATVHMLSGITLIPIFTACILKARGRVRDIVLTFSLAVVGFAIGLSPVLTCNYLSFGNIFKTGYDYWSRWGGGGQIFSLLYAIENTGVPEAGAHKGNIIYYIWHFLGLSWPSLFAPYFPTILFFAFCGAFACFKGKDDSQRGIFAFGSMSVSLTVAITIVLFFYSYQMAKFFLPIVPFICSLAAYGIIVLLQACRGADIRSRLLRIPVAILLLVTAWGCWKPYSSGHFSRTTPTWWYEGIMVLNKIAPNDAYLISGIDGVYITYYFVMGTDRTYMPISRKVEYIRQRDLPLRVAMENTDYIKRLLGQGKKVYMDGFTYNWWGSYRAVLARNFVFVPVASYYGGRLNIYELASRKL